MAYSGAAAGFKALFWIALMASSASTVTDGIAGIYAIAGCEDTARNILGYGEVVASGVALFASGAATGVHCKKKSEDSHDSANWISIAYFVATSLFTLVGGILVLTKNSSNTTAGLILIVISKFCNPLLTLACSANVDTFHERAQLGNA